MVGIIRRPPSPEWLLPWLKFPFYEVNCKKHPTKYITVKCDICMIEPVCELCWKHVSEKHQGDGHRILKVRSASDRAAIETKDMGKLWDISGIHQYSINGKSILHLNSKSSDKNGGPKYLPLCETCGHKLPNGSPHSFCSIACKYYKSFEDDIQIERNIDPRNTSPNSILDRIQIEMNTTTSEEEEEEEEEERNTRKRKRKGKRTEECRSIRKKSRKGIARRAPLQ